MSKASKTNIRRYGEDTYAKRGSIGGKAKVPKGFAKMSKERLIEIARKSAETRKRNAEKARTTV